MMARYCQDKNLLTCNVCNLWGFRGQASLNVHRRNCNGRFSILSGGSKHDNEVPSQSDHRISNDDKGVKHRGYICDVQDEEVKREEDDDGEEEEDQDDNECFAEQMSRRYKDKNLLTCRFCNRWAFRGQASLNIHSRNCNGTFNMLNDGSKQDLEVPSHPGHQIPSEDEDVKHGRYICETNGDDEEEGDLKEDNEWFDKHWDSHGEASPHIHSRICSNILTAGSEQGVKVPSQPGHQMPSYEKDVKHAKYFCDMNSDDEDEEDME